tara:strand:+ start:141 stop:494 length:354 start_codon:yes stop_codon:yes gene_type:complete
MTRYIGRDLLVNNTKEYQESLLDRRDLVQIIQYSTARFYYPTFQERAAMSTVPFVWTATSKMYNVAAQFYGDPKLWWLIGWFNQKPTEAHWKVGDVAFIPANSKEVLTFFRRQNGTF